MLPVLLLLAGCGSLSHIELDTNDAGAQRFAHSGDLRAEVDSLATPLVESGETPGVMVGVLTADGGMHFYSYGVADRNTGAPPGPDTLFAVGSLSKGFLGAITDSLVQQGLLHWDDTLEKLLPPGTPLSDTARKITLLQLATHTSGLPRQPMNPQTLRYFIEYEFTGKDFYRHFDTAYVLNYLADFDTPPSETPEYSNVGYGLLGYIVEQHTGQSLDVLLQRMITDPLGMTHTGYQPEQLPGYAERARGYAGDHPLFLRRGRPTPDFHLSEMMRGTGAAYSTARDLLTFAAACLKPDDSALSAVLADTLRVRVPQATGAVGIAWFDDDVDGEHITYQEGLTGGYSSYLGLDRRNHIAVVVLQNSFNWTFAVGHRLLLRMAKAEELKEASPGATEAATAAAGGGANKLH